MKKTTSAAPEQVSKKETEILLELCEKSLAVDGDVVELGCFRGDTSVLFEKIVEKYNRDHQLVLTKSIDPPEIHEKFLSPKICDNGFKRLWLYDSFEGLPEKTREDQSSAGKYFQGGELKVSKYDVILKFKQRGLKVPIIKKAFFEDLDETQDIPEKICFGFLDGDFYQSIKTSLELTVPKVGQNSILVVHDYNNPELPGPSKAVDEFLKNFDSFKRFHNLKIAKPRLELRETLAILKF